MMRPTTNDYIERLDKGLSLSEFYDKVTKFAKLTNRKPMLGDFVATDEEGNVLEEPQLIDVSNGFDVVDAMWDEEEVKRYQAAQSRIIFKGDWEVELHDPDLVRIINKKEQVRLSFSMGQCYDFRTSFLINHIEDLPREIEFINGLI